MLKVRTRTLFSAGAGGREADLDLDDFVEEREGLFFRPGDFEERDLVAALDQLVDLDRDLERGGMFVVFG